MSYKWIPCYSIKFTFDLDLINYGKLPWRAGYWRHGMISFGWLWFAVFVNRWPYRSAIEGRDKR